MAKPTPWDVARRTILERIDSMQRRRPVVCKLERGVNYFVLELEKMGAVTRYSCEGHPTGFYITFTCPYRVAVAIEAMGYFRVEVEGPRYFSIRLPSVGSATEYDKRHTLRLASIAWANKVQKPRLKSLTETEKELWKTNDQKRIAQPAG